jgi:hypothetical protein
MYRQTVLQGILNRFNLIHSAVRLDNTLHNLFWFAKQLKVNLIYCAWHSQFGSRLRWPTVQTNTIEMYAGFEVSKEEKAEILQTCLLKGKLRLGAKCSSHIQGQRIGFIRYEVFVAVTLKYAVVWCDAVRIIKNRRFGGTYLLHH